MRLSRDVGFSRRGGQGNTHWLQKNLEVREIAVTSARSNTISECFRGRLLQRYLRAPREGGGVIDPDESRTM